MAEHSENEGVATNGVTGHPRICETSFGPPRVVPHMSTNRRAVPPDSHGRNRGSVGFCGLLSAPFIVNSRNQSQLVAREIRSAHGQAMVPWQTAVLAGHGSACRRFFCERLLHKHEESQKSGLKSRRTQHRVSRYDRATGKPQRLPPLAERQNVRRWRGEQRPRREEPSSFRLPIVQLRRWKSYTSAV